MVEIIPNFVLEPEKAGETVERIKQWIRDWFTKNGGITAILGMSGGKDSTVCAKMLVDALGADNVYGVFMPNGTQSDFQDAMDAAAYAGLIHTRKINIGGAYDSLSAQMDSFDRHSPAGINLAPRLRMAALYMVAQGLPGGRVCCTGNRSEATVGYCTLYGDLAGDFAPILGLFKEDVCAIGKYLGLPEHLVDKTPSDGLSGLSDEDKLGFSYADIREYCLSGCMKLPKETFEKVHAMSERNGFKDRLVHLPRWWGPGVADA